MTHIEMKQTKMTKTTKEEIKRLVPNAITFAKVDVENGGYVMLNINNETVAVWSTEYEKGIKYSVLSIK